MKSLLTLVFLPPILLIHGYGEDAHVWDSWLSWLKTDHLTAAAVTFVNDDQCGTVKDHAAELDKILSHYDGKVNIVAHSKGGLDARWYISHSGSTTGKVEKLVMLGTPNQGTNAAWQDLTSCSIQGSSGLWDLMPGSDAIKSVDNPATHYYTIAGNYSVPCLFVLGFMYTCWALQNDGWVTVTSALSHYKSLGIYPYAHNDLLTHRDVYEKVLRELTRLSNH